METDSVSAVLSIRNIRQLSNARLCPSAFQVLQLLGVLILGHEEHLVVGIERGIACPNRSRCEMLHLTATMCISHFFHLRHCLSDWHSDLILLHCVVV